jgi:hypothetical protein
VWAPIGFAFSTLLFTFFSTLKRLRMQSSGSVTRFCIMQCSIACIRATRRCFAESIPQNTFA